MDELTFDQILSNACSQVKALYGYEIRLISPSEDILNRFEWSLLTNKRDGRIIRYTLQYVDEQFELHSESAEPPPLRRTFVENEVDYYRDQLHYWIEILTARANSHTGN